MGTPVAAATPSSVPAVAFTVILLVAAAPLSSLTINCAPAPAVTALGIVMTRAAAVLVTPIRKSVAATVRSAAVAVR